jgi:hypothetical protein
MRKAELTPNEPTPQPPAGWSPPQWLLKVLAKCWWLIGFEMLGLLRAYPNNPAARNAIKPQAKWRNAR